MFKFQFLMFHSFGALFSAIVGKMEVKSFRILVKFRDNLSQLLDT